MSVDAVTDVSRETSAPAAIFVEPDAADRAPRRVEPRDMPHDPEAPFGWMVDRKTGERRPKKTAGRQLPAGKGKAVPAPRKRPANRPRVAPPTAPTDMPAPVVVADHAAMVSDIIDAAWTVAAAVKTPAPGAKLLGVSTYALTLRSKGTAAVMGEHKPALAHTLGTMADKIPQVGAAVEWLAREDGPGWILQGALVLLPFVSACQAMWSAPLDQLVPIAANMDRQFAELAQSQAQLMAAHLAAQQSAAADVSRETSAAMYPGEVMLPGMGG